MTMQNNSGARGGFSLVEMLVVLAVIALLIGIIIPAVAGGRTAARNADTRSGMVQLGNACSQFEIDQRRRPGYFSSTQMGAGSNAATYGFTSMDNVMLDLLGGITKKPRDVASGIISVGPGNNDQTQVNVDINALGAPSQAAGSATKSYFTVDKRFVAQTGANKRLPSMNDNVQLPVLTDGYGQPILAWVQSDSSATTVFAAENTNNANVIPSFTLAANAGFLADSVTSLGKRGETMKYVMNSEGSILNESNMSGNRIDSLESLLGNPVAPDPAAPANDQRPLRARAPIVFHSAGNNGVYLGVNERAGKTGVVRYAPNLDPITSGGFDDIVTTTGQ